MARTLPRPDLDPLVVEGGLVGPRWAEYFAQLTNVDGYVFKRPSCHVSRSTAQTITTATWTDVLWTAEDHDNYAMHSTTTNTDRVTIPEAGVYAFGAHVIWESNATNARRLAITLNDAAAPAATAILVDASVDANVLTAATTRQLVTGTRSLSASNILRCAVYQDSGGDLDVTAGDPLENGFWCFKVSN